MKKVPDTITCDSCGNKIPVDETIDKGTFNGGSTKLLATCETCNLEIFAAFDGEQLTITRVTEIDDGYPMV